jgi:hypothetical protein
VSVAGEQPDPTESRRAMSRYPSCLISWTQSGPDGGRSAAEGRHGSMNPEGDMPEIDKRRVFQSRLALRGIPAPLPDDE